MLKKDSYLQPKFLAVEMNTKMKKNLIVLLYILFSIVSTNQCYAKVAVGDLYDGGTVFCVSDTPDTSKCVITGSGKYGLIMANVDQVNYDSNDDHGVNWASEYKEAGAHSEDDGLANTATIIAAHPNDNGTNNAAWMCHNYNTSEDYTGPGLSAWYLPAKNELNKMYLYAKANNLIGRNCTGKKDNGVQCLISGYDDDMYYWSSTEYPGGGYNCAWYQLFRYGFQYGYDKVNYLFGVRAVRAFNNSTIQQFINEMRTALYNVLDTMPMDLINIITSYTTEVPSREMLRNTECLTKKGVS